jgi:hypothetical protein
MLKLLTITFLLNSALFAVSTSTEVENFLKKSFSSNRNIDSLKIKVVDKIEVSKLKGWDAYVVNVDATLKAGAKKRHVKQNMVWFSNGSLITQDLIDIKTGVSVKDLVAPQFKQEHYKKHNLISGDENSTYKVAIFSDPLCPFCRSFVPGAIREMVKQPKKFALYYYHLPLSAIHPASVTLVKAAIVAELHGYKDVILKMYDIDLDPHQRDTNKILAAFNKLMKTNITQKDLDSPQVTKYYKSDMKVVDELMVQGTPTMYFNGKIDKTKRKYKEVK